MARLVVLAFSVLAMAQALLLGGCSALDTRSAPVPQPTSLESSSDELTRLDDGQHHPAIQALLSKAETARGQQQMQKALGYLDRARQIQPRNSAILYRQAWLNYSLGYAQEAQQLLKRAQVFQRSDERLKRRILRLHKLVTQSLQH